MRIKKKALVIGAAVTVVCAVAGVMVWKETQAQMFSDEEGSCVYAYVSGITGNEITYTELEESVVTAYLEQQEAEIVSEEQAEDAKAEDESGDKKMKDDGGMPEETSDMRRTETITTQIPVGITVHTQSDMETTFGRLAAGDIIKMLTETTETGEEVITEIWML